MQPSSPTNSPGPLVDSTIWPFPRCMGWGALLTMSVTDLADIMSAAHSLCLRGRAVVTHCVSVSRWGSLQWPVVDLYASHIASRLHRLGSCR